MRRRQEDNAAETYRLTCPVCGALPGTTCLDEEYQELERVHPSRKMSVAERNRRSADGWMPPELAEREQARREAALARAPLFGAQLRRAAADGNRVRAAVPARRPRKAARPAAPARSGPGRREQQQARTMALAAFLSRFPAGTPVPRRELRDLARRQWGGLQDQAAGGHRGGPGRRAGAGKGSMTAMLLAESLRMLESDGLVVRDPAADAVIVSDPGGLRAAAGPG